MDNVKRKSEGLPYCYDDPALLSDQHLYQDQMRQYNLLMPSDIDGRSKMLKKVFLEIGEGCTVEQPIHSNWGCRHVHLGDGVYVNSNVTFVDDAEIWIGDNCLIAPNVVFCTAGHPILPILREHHYVYNLPIHIGKNVWIGSSVQVMPGVTIGDNSVIGAGSVVTHDIPSDCVAYGVPCEVIREIGEKDEKYYYKNRELDIKE